MNQRQGLPLPDAIKNKPQLNLGLDLFYSGFLDLTDERQSGWGAGPIPWRAMSDYCYAHEIVGEQRESFFHLVKRMDAAYLKRMDEKRPKG